RAVRAGAVGVPCELGLRSSILMKQKNMLPVKTLLKNLPRKTGGGQVSQERATLTGGTLAGEGRQFKVEKGMLALDYGATDGSGAAAQRAAQASADGSREAVRRAWASLRRSPTDAEHFAEQRVLCIEE